MDSIPTHYIAVKRPGTKKAFLLANGNALTRLRIHANRYSKETAEKFCLELAALNPGYTFTPKLISTEEAA